MDYVYIIYITHTHTHTLIYVHTHTHTRTDTHIYISPSFLAFKGAISVIESHTTRNVCEPDGIILILYLIL